MAWRIGIDIGGTFTDVALVDDAGAHVGVAKVPTTPGDLAQGVLARAGHGDAPLPAAPRKTWHCSRTRQRS